MAIPTQRVQPLPLGRSSEATPARRSVMQAVGDHFHGVAVPKLGFPLNSQIVFRGNQLDSNSGIRVERQAEDVLIEGTVNLHTDTVEPIVTPDCLRVLVQ